MSQVILFDLDGTLTESGEGIINCVQYALEKLGKKEEHPENLQCFIGPPLKEQFMKYAGLDEETAVKAVKYYRERYSNVGIFENKPYPGVENMLQELKRKKYILAVASSKPEDYVKQILDHFHLTEYFDEIVGSEMNGARTNKTEVIEEALERIGMKSRWSWSVIKSMMYLEPVKPDWTVWRFLMDMGQRKNLKRRIRCRQ